MLVPMLVALASIPWLGCTSPSEQAPTDLTVFEYDAPDEPSPQLTVDEVEAALEGVVGKIFEYHAQPMLDVYWELVQDTDEACPSWYATENSDYWIAADDGAAGQDTEGEQGGCLTAGQTEYRGWAYTQDMDGYEAGEGWVVDKDYVSALAWIWTPEGHLYEAAGTLLTSTQAQDGESGTLTLVESRIEGVFGWDGPGLEDTWLGRGELPDMAIEAQSMLQRHNLEVEGGVSNVQDVTGIDAFAVNDFLYADEFHCAVEPSGVVSLRQTDGQWWDIHFDGPTEQQDAEVPDDDDCDGCGRAFFRGQEWGTVCLDFTPLLDWDVSPWG